MNHSNSLNWNEIIERIFQLYNAKTNKSLAESLGYSTELIRRWRDKNEERRIYPTWDTLQKIVIDNKIDWQWLLTGKGVTDAVHPARNQLTKDDADFIEGCARIQEGIGRLLSEFLDGNEADRDMIREQLNALLKSYQDRHQSAG